MAMTLNMCISRLYRAVYKVKSIGRICVVIDSELLYILNDSELQIVLHFYDYYYGGVYINVIKSSMICTILHIFFHNKLLQYDFDNPIKHD